MQSCRNIASWHGDAFCLMGPLWEESIGHWRFPRVLGQKCGCFLFLFCLFTAPRSTGATSQGFGELRHIIVHIASQWWCYTFGVWRKYITELSPFHLHYIWKCLKPFFHYLVSSFISGCKQHPITSLIYFRGNVLSLTYPVTLIEPPF